MLFKNSILHWSSFSNIKVSHSQNIIRHWFRNIKPKTLFSLKKPKENQKKSRWHSLIFVPKIQSKSYHIIYTVYKWILKKTLNSLNVKNKKRNQTRTSTFLFKGLGRFTFHSIYPSSFKIFVPVTILCNIPHCNSVIPTWFINIPSFFLSSYVLI